MPLRQRLLSLGVFLILTAALAAPAAHAQTACEAEFQAALTSITDASLFQGNAQKILTKVRSGWRMYASASQNGKTNALKQLRAADDLIDGASMKGVSAEVKQSLHASIESLRACLTSAPAIVTSSLTVKVVTVAAEGSGETPQPAGANVIVTAASLTAKTKGDGTVTMTVPVGTYSVRAQLGNALGETKTTVVAGTPAQAQVLLIPGRDTSLQVVMSATEIVDGALPRDFAGLNIRLENELGEAIAVDKIEQVEIGVAASEWRVITPMFRVASGAIALADRAAFAAFVLERIDPFELRVRALDKAGNTYNASLRFAIGRFRPTAAVTGVAGANVSINLHHERTGFNFWATSGADGALSWPLLPDGPYLIEGETVQNGRRYFARGGFVLDRDKPFSASFFALTAVPTASSEPTSRVQASTDSAQQRAAAEALRLNRKWHRIEADGSTVPDDAPRAKFPVLAINIDTELDYGNFKARFVDVLDWPEPLAQIPEQELSVIDAGSAANEHASRLDRPVTIRGLDSAGKIVFSNFVMVRTRLTGDVLRAPGTPDPEPRLRAASEANESPEPVSFRIRVPLTGVESIEIRGWRPGQVVLWEVAALRADRALANIDALRGDR